MNGFSESQNGCINEWQQAAAKLIGLLDFVGTYAIERPVTAIVHYSKELPPEQVQKLGNDLMDSYRVKSRILHEHSYSITAQVNELHRIEEAVSLRLTLAQNELSKLYGGGSYVFATEELTKLAYETRIWASQTSRLWRDCQPVVSIDQENSFDNAELTCPWNVEISKRITKKYQAELSQLLRDTATHPVLDIAGTEPLSTTKDLLAGGTNDSERIPLTANEKLEVIGQIRLVAKKLEFHKPKSKGIFAVIGTMIGGSDNLMTRWFNELEQTKKTDSMVRLLQNDLRRAIELIVKLSAQATGAFEENTQEQLNSIANEIEKTIEEVGDKSLEGAQATEEKPKEQSNATTTGKKRGRKPKQMNKEEKQVWEYWNSGSYGSYVDVDKALNKTLGTTATIVERIKKRNQRKSADAKGTI